MCQLTDITFSGLNPEFFGLYIIQLQPMHILKTPVQDEGPSRSPEDERVQRPRRPELESH